MSGGYRLLHFRDGEVPQASEHGERDSAERAFARDFERASHNAPDDDADLRIELWGEDALLGVFDSHDRP